MTFREFFSGEPNLLKGYFYIFENKSNISTFGVTKLETSQEFHEDKNDHRRFDCK